jgi:tRNA(fMet)-specific endonuclease VapC
MTDAGVTRYLLDASVVFAIVLGEHATLARLGRLDVADVAIPSLVWSEVLAADEMNAADPRRAENLALLGETIDILPFDRAAAELYARMMRRLSPKRRRVLDRMTAAQARAHGFTLVTLAPRDFADIPGLTVEDWSTAVSVYSTSSTFSGPPP